MNYYFSMNKSSKNIKHYFANCPSFMSEASASEVFPLAICSSHRPNETKVINIGGVSKKVRGECSVLTAIAQTTIKIEYRYEIEVAITIRTSILSERCLIAAYVLI